MKIFRQENGTAIKKANCDVDLTFYAMKEINHFKRAIFLSGDGDFDILLQYFVKLKKEIIVFANSRRTAREIKQLKGIQFNDLQVLKPTIERIKK